MKNILLLWIFIFFTITSFSQNCDPDNTLPSNYEGIISPLADSEMPCDTLVPRDTAYIETGYSTTFTMFFPSVDIDPIESIIMKPADDENPGLIGLPEGLTYSCEPESCEFLSGIYGCINIHGIVDGSVNPGLYDLLITFKLNSLIIDGEIHLPLPEDPNDYTALENILVDVDAPFSECPYQILVAGGVSTQNLFETQFSMGQNNPNPFREETSISVNAKDGNYTFSIYNTVGELVHTKELRLQGRSNINVDASNFETGVYFYTFSNGNGSVAKRMIVR